MINYVVYFTGYWPVGAVALVRANNAGEAVQKLFDKLPDVLKKKNSDKDGYPSGFTVKALSDNDVNILLDGEY